jgi:hypothetical protein
MLWNELSYDMQVIVLDRFSALMTKEENEEMQMAMIAGISELEIWSNSPVNAVDVIPNDEPYVAHAVYAEDNQ